MGYAWEVIWGKYPRAVRDCGYRLTNSSGTHATTQIQGAIWEKTDYRGLGLPLDDL